MGRTSEETSLSLVWDENFGSGTFTDRTQVSPSRASSPEMSTFSFFARPVSCAYLLITRVSARAEAGKVRAPVALRDVVGEAEDVFVIAVIPLQGGLDDDAVLLGHGIDGLRDRRGALAVDMLDEGFNAALVLQHGFPRLGPAQVAEDDLDAGVEEGEFAQTMLERRAVELNHRENRRARQEADGGAGLVARAVGLHRRIADDAQRRFWLAEEEAHACGPCRRGGWSGRGVPRAH